MGHSHDHSHDHRGTSRRRLAWTLGLVVVYMAAEVVGGVLSGSLALLSDAGHMLSDAASLGLALFALWMAEKPRSPERTFGYHRIEILAALVNGAALVAIAVFIVVEAWHRLESPREIDGRLMLWIAVGGLVVNLAGLAILHQGRSESLNVRGAWLHVLADTLGSVQAIAAGAVIWAFGWTWADPVAAVLIALLVAWSSWTLLRDSVNVLMEATPRHIDAAEVERAICGVDGVDGVHDLHVWTISSGFESLSAHVEVAGRDTEEVLGEIGRLVHRRFDIEHTTIQTETGEGCVNGRCD